MVMVYYSKRKQMTSSKGKDTQVFNIDQDCYFKFLIKLADCGPGPQSTNTLLGESMGKARGCLRGLACSSQGSSVQTFFKMPLVQRCPSHRTEGFEQDKGDDDGDDEFTVIS